MTWPATSYISRTSASSALHSSTKTGDLTDSTFGVAGAVGAPASVALDAGAALLPAEGSSRADLDYFAMYDSV
jgi:hypothetical protein